MRRTVPLGLLLTVALEAPLAPAQTLVGVFGESGAAAEERLATIDLATGELTLIGSDLGLGLRRQGSGYDPATGRMYFQALAHGEANDAPYRIWTADVATGAVLANPQVTIDADFDELHSYLEIDRSDGRLYGIFSRTADNDRSLFEIDPATGSATQVGAAVFATDLGGLGTSGLDPTAGVFYFTATQDGAGSSSEMRIWSADLGDGSLLNAPPLIAPPGSYDPRPNFAIFDPLTSRLLLLLFDATPSRQLVSLNPTTGAASAVGSPLAIDSVSAGVSALDVATGTLAFIGRPTGGSDFLLFQVDVSDGSVLAMPMIMPPGTPALSAFPAYLEFVPEPGAGAARLVALAALLIVASACSTSQGPRSSPKNEKPGS